MKNEEPTSSLISYICTAFIAIALVYVGMADTLLIKIAALSVTMLLVWSVYAIYGKVQKRDFTDRAIAKLTKAGLPCKKDADGIVVKQGDFIINAKLWDNGTHGMKRVHFVFDFTPQKLDSVLPEGWALLAAECNAYYDHTMMKFYGDHLSCMVVTSVKNAKDFLEEYHFAIEQINETLQGMQANADRVAKQFPARKKRAGFIIDTQ